MSRDDFNSAENDRASQPGRRRRIRISQDFNEDSGVDGNSYGNSEGDSKGYTKIDKNGYSHYRKEGYKPRKKQSFIPKAMGIERTFND
jgi:hypothetical protein